MRKFGMFLAAAAVTVGALATSPLAQAAQVAPPPPNPVVNVVPSNPIQPLDCRGTTGDMGCGPGWFWRDGWRGFACYPC